MVHSQPESIDCTSAVEMQAFGATLLQQAQLTQGIELLHYRHLPAELPDLPAQQHLILINTQVPPETHIEQVIEGKLQQAEMAVEDLIVFPAGVPSSARWNQPHNYLALCLDPAALQQRAGDLARGYRLEVLPQFAISDPLLRSLGLALQTELQSPGFAGQLYIDALLTTLTAHLVRHYCAQQPLPLATSALPPATLHRVLDYIQAHLAQDLTLSELAAIAQVSPSYFATQFKRAVGVAPHQYVIQRRIEQAQRLLIARSGTIAEIASRVGFADQSHLTRHFKRLLGVTPKQFLANQ